MMKIVVVGVVVEPMVMNETQENMKMKLMN